VDENLSACVIVPYQPISTLDTVQCPYRPSTALAALNAANNHIRTLREPYGG
jgi:hypothetical protein